MTSPEHKVALSFLAHPDDAEILCAGTLMRLREAGWEVHIATATPGDCGSATLDRWQIEKKAEMLACHASQRDWLRAHHGMDEYLEAMRRHGETRGREMGVKYAEAFIQHRGHAYPHDDLLAGL